MDRIYTIRTPEMVRFDFRLAGPGSRCLAWSIDMLVLAGAMAVVFLVGCVVSGILAISAGQMSGFGAALLLVAGFVVYHGYFAFFEWRWSGRTPGKRLLGLRVIQDNGTRIAPFQAMARNFARVVDSAAPFYTIGLGSLLVTPRLQRLGDVISGTIVIRDDRDSGPPSAALLRGEVAGALAADKGLARRMARRLSKDERELLVDSARRADEIDLAIRGPLFEKLAAHFATRLELERDPHVSDEKLVQNLARALLAYEREGAAGGL